MNLHIRSCAMRFREPLSAARYNEKTGRRSAIRFPTLYLGIVGKQLLQFVQAKTRKYNKNLH